MKLKVLAILLEAIALGGLSTAGVVVGFPFVVKMGLHGFSQKPVNTAFGMLVLAGCVWALVEYWRLAGKTAFSLPYRFGTRFWVAAAGGLAGLANFFGILGPRGLFLLVGLPVIGAVHFAYLQRIRARPSISGGSSGA